MDNSKVQFYTTAPRAYDYGWTLPLIDDVAVTDHGKSVRLVECESRYYADNQMARNGSGLHASWESEAFQKEIAGGFVTLTPQKEIHYKRAVVNIGPFLDSKPSNEAIDAFRSLVDTVGDMPGVKIEPSGDKYFLIFFGTKKFCEQKFVDIVTKFNTILGITE